jgi:AraC-like DNA-binding protein
VRLLWQARDPQARGRVTHQRVLPAGRLELILNLAERGLTDCSGTTDAESAPALIVGVQTRWEKIAEADFEDLMGVVFEPGGFAALFPEGASAFSEQSIDLEAVDARWTCSLRDRIREHSTAASRFAILEAALEQRLRGTRSAVVDFALREIRRGTSIGEITSQTGLSAGALGERFRYQVGTTLKVYARIVRFSEAVKRMHRGADVRWVELAADCGYYDQAHFCNEFRAFSGICPSAYAASDRIWANHLPVD